MPTAEVNGALIAYELIGDGPPWTITPGGRLSKDTPGLRELATGLAEHGYSALIWDRPNTGASDVVFTGASESDMQADHLAGLLRALELPPAMILGGSGGARTSLLTVARHPDVAAGLVIVWMSGGVYGRLCLAVHYCGESFRWAWRDGMEAVVALPEWEEVLERNPRNRDRFLAQDPKEFTATLERWMLAYCPDGASTVPGITDEECSRIAVPALIFRSGASDPNHTRATTERLHEVIPGSRLVEPPWGDREWNERSDAARTGTGHLFERWPLLLPQLLEFADAISLREGAQRR